MVELLGTTIELITLIGFSLLVLFGILGYTKKMKLEIALFSGIAGFVIAWIFAPFNQLIIRSMTNSIWYGYAWDLSGMLGVLTTFTIIIAIIVGGMNLYQSDGELIWA